MAKWQNKPSECISREGNTIYIKNLDHAKTATDFIRVLKEAINKRGYKQINIDFTSVASIFPNAGVPIPGIIDHYENEGISFEYVGVDYVERFNIIGSTVFSKSNSKVLGKVWSFSTSEEVARIVDAYMLELQKSAQFYKGVLNSIEWALNEVLDNVIQHSKISAGYVMGQLHTQSKIIAFTIFDAGQGIYNSLKNSEHNPRTAVDAITLAIQEEVTRDKKIGQGNGLFGLHSIVKQGKGKLGVLSGTGFYTYNEGVVKTYDKMPCMSLETPGTMIDFQLSYAEDLSLDRALVFRGKQYEMLNLRFEEMEDDNGHIIYKIRERAEGTGTRESAIRVKNEIFNILTQENKPITIDFSGVEVISSSFSDELLAKLFLGLGLFQFNNLIRIKGLDLSQQRVLQRSVLQRIIEDLKNDGEQEL